MGQSKVSRKRVSRKKKRTDRSPGPRSGSKPAVEIPAPVADDLEEAPAPRSPREVMDDIRVQVSETMEMLAGARAFLDPSDDDEARTWLGSTAQIMLSAAERIERALRELDRVEL